ncbi:hypothetical protein ACLMJK_003657 [Lecanora helva]
MGANEIIDLLSSDNEGQTLLTKPSLKSTQPSSPLTSFSPVDSEDDWLEPPAKRRKRSLSSFIDDRISRPPSLPMQPTSPKLHKGATLQGSDPIIFTSSIKATVKHGKVKAVAKVLSDSNLSDDSFPDDILPAAPRNKPSGISIKTAAILEKLSQPLSRMNQSSKRKGLKDPQSKKLCKQPRTSSDDGDSDGDSDQKRATAKSCKAPRKAKLTEEEKAAKACAKEQERALKAKEKERVKVAKEKKAKDKEDDQENKRILKEQRAREKRIAADLAEANKSKLDKKDSTPEMIVDLPPSIAGQSVDTQIREHLKNLGVDATLYQSSIPNVIKWRRKMKARWNVDHDYWEPIEQMEIHEEKHVMCLMPAKEFVALATVRDDEADIGTHVAKLKSAYDSRIPIYLIEGLHTWMRKNKTAENRAYQAKVNSISTSNNPNSSSQPASRKKSTAMEIIDEDLIEDALLRLQVLNGCLVHHSATSGETAEWVAHFTQHISTIPYRTQRMNLETTFCMESGQVKTGEDKDDTFVKMLQEVVRVTPPIAYGIASEYPNVISLIEAFRRHGPNVLEYLQKSANRNGALTDRKIGPAISRRLYKVFMELDPSSTDI